MRVAGFMVASVLCGAAESLTMEVISRIIQGMSGAFLIPLSHAIVLDTYPPEEHGQAMALWGTGSVLRLGGRSRRSAAIVTEYWSWRWIYYINVPLGMIRAARAASRSCPRRKRDPNRRLDWIGFLTLAIGVGALQMMLDRGQRLDWFESGEIVVLACMAALGLYLFVVHSLTTHAIRFLDPRLIMQRQFFRDAAVHLVLRISVDAAAGDDADVPGAPARLHRRRDRLAADRRVAWACSPRCW